MGAVVDLENIQVYVPNSGLKKEEYSLLLISLINYANHLASSNVNNFSKN